MTCPESLRLRQANDYPSRQLGADLFRELLLPVLVKWGREE